MYHQFDVSPGKRRTVVATKENEPEIEVLSLVPFAAAPKIYFENVILGSTARKHMLIKNPTCKNIELGFTKLPPEERGLNLNWYHEIILANGELLLELTWRPIEEGGWCDKMTIEGGSRIKKDVTIIFKAVCAKKQKRVPKNSSRTAPKFLVKRTTSPVKQRNKSPKKSVIQKIKSSPKFSKYEKQMYYTLQSINNIDKVCFENQNLSNVALIRDSISKTPEKFNDSLEMDPSPKSTNFNKSPKILGDITCTPLMNPNVRTNLSPYYYYTSKTVSKHIESVQKSINCSNLLKAPAQTQLSPDINDSTGTYVVDENSRTFVKDVNISSATYTKDNSLEIKAEECSARYDSVLFPISNSCKKQDSNRQFSKGYNLQQITEESSPPTIIQNAAMFIKNSPQTRHVLKLECPSNSIKEPLNKIKDSVLDQNMLRPTGKCVSISDIKMFSVADPLDPTKPIFDPFMLSSPHFDCRWMDEQKNYFIKWLNVLLAPPKELNCNTEGVHLSPADLWQKCKSLATAPAAPTKEAVCLEFHVQGRLNSLRKAATNLYKSENISLVLWKVANVIDSDKLKVRSDRNVHLDLTLQEGIMKLFLNYNPLWLRIGLETIYNTKIPLSSNSDIYGLTHFVLNRFFKDPQLIRKHGSVYSDKYTVGIKRLILKRFISLVYFLDQAKTLRLIGHDPCLFCKNGSFKESRDILINFTKETISAIGDITKDLKKFGYVVSHKQTYIHEFEYTVTCLGSDLRDGVRLAKVIEIILLVDNVTANLRVPPISRLQKMHNMKLVFEALDNAGFQILYDICPKDIVEGCREKTLSFLWQIICKFETPRFVKAAGIIQHWWRSLRITIVRRISTKMLKKRERAAVTIQRAFRRKHFFAKLEDFIFKLKLYLLAKRQEKAAVLIQSCVKMYLQRKWYRNMLRITIRLQSHWRAFIIRKSTAAKLTAIIKLQTYTRTYLTRKYYLELKKSVILIQQQYRANQFMKKERSKFEQLKNAAVVIQSRYKAWKIMESEKQEYRNIKNAAITIQRHFRSYILTKIERERFLKLKQAVIYVEVRYSAQKCMKYQLKHYRTLRISAIIIQTRFRGYILMKEQRALFLRLKRAAICIQMCYRMYRLMRQERTNYVKIKNAAIIIQTRFRAYLSMKAQHEKFVKLRNATVCAQNYYRAKILMRNQIKIYQDIRTSAIIVQRRFRANILMKQQRDHFLKLKQAVNFIENHFVARKITRRELATYKTIKNATITLQQHIRAFLLKKRQQRHFIELKQAAVFTQRRFRANQLMISERNAYISIKNAAIVVQTRFRAYLLMKQQRERFRNLKRAAVVVRRYYKARKLLKEQRENYINLRRATIVIQQRFRALVAMQNQRARFRIFKQAIISIQRRLRAHLLMKLQRHRYETVRKSAMVIQRRFRAQLLMKETRSRFVILKRATVYVQIHYRAQQLMKLERNKLNTLKNSAIVIQKRFKATLLMRTRRSIYVQLKETTIWIQRHLRARQLARKDMCDYKKLKNAAVVVQTRFRAYLLMQEARRNYECILQAVKCIQVYYRAYLLMKIERNYFIKLKNAVVYVQKKFRANLQMMKDRSWYLGLKKYAVVVQQRYKANQSMKAQRREYIQIKSCVVRIQTFIRSYQLVKREKEIFKNKIKTIVNLQAVSRRYLLRKNLEEIKIRTIRERKECRAATKIQSIWRGYVVRKRNPALDEIRQRAARANSTATLENTLGYRRNKAITKLDGNVTVFSVINLLQDIDFVTRTCRNSCVMMSTLMPDYLYRILTSINRSLPEMEIAVQATAVLINFCKCSLSINNIWQPERMEKIFGLMLIWCDKEALLFPYLCTFVWLLCHKQEYKNVIVNIPNFERDIQKIYVLCARKEKMYKHNNTKISVFFSPHKLQLPTTEASWRYIRCDKPYMFTNSPHALASVIDICKL